MRLLLNLLFIKVAKLSEHAIIPTRGSAKAAGYDLYSAYDYVIPARGKCLAKTDVQVYDNNKTDIEIQFLHYFITMAKASVVRYLFMILVLRSKYPTEPTVELRPGLASHGRTTSISELVSSMRTTGR